ncbi:SMI1/KNR4 family protein [Sphingobacterium anhuiense]|uniref:SMI1/KNR4 family protein n=1 Tax=Sphingobacterium anhuiense TaxID=493780 RepID=UPI003C3031EC
MSTLKKECERVLKELYLFSDNIIYFGNRIEDNRLELLEENLAYKFPMDFKYILKKHNGISLMGTEIYGLDVSLKGNSLDKIYEFEHYKVSNKMPKEFLPFSPDGRGNHYCLNLAKIIDGICPVVFWQWDYDYLSFEDVEECNDNFLSWIEEVMIEWILEDYNYDGTDK